MQSPFSRTQIVVHWLIALLLVVSFVSHDGIKLTLRTIRNGTPEITTPAIVHVGVGLAILVLALFRLALRIRRGRPPEPEGSSPMLAFAAYVTHWSLYALLILIPLSGAATWFLGIHALGDVHGVLFTIGWLLVALHVLASLYHQFILKDGLMQRMKLRR